MTLVWLAVALAFAVAEIATLAFYAVFIVIGALAASLAAYLGVPLPGQVVAFAVVSVLGLFAARPPLLRYMKRDVPAMGSGAQSMIGQDAPVVDEIGGSHERGHVQVHGESWPALSADGSVIPVGSIVTIEGLKQATLVVSLKAKEG
jgi:membrane protein implicated in regulation of membrane protease activity